MDDPAVCDTRWVNVPRTPGFEWQDDPRYEFPGHRQRIEDLAVEGGATNRQPENGHKCDRSDGVWIPCNPWRDGAISVWIWWANA